MRRAGGMFERLCSFENLCRAFRESSAGLRSRWEVQAFEVDLERNLWRIHRHLARGEYRWGAYRRFLIHDPKRREIRAAPFPDRVVHHAIFNVLDPVIRRWLIPDTYACIPGRGTHAAVERFRPFVRARGGKGYATNRDGRTRSRPSCEPIRTTVQRHEHVGIDADHRRARRRTVSCIIPMVTGFRGFLRMPLRLVIEPVTALSR